MHNLDQAVIVLGIVYGIYKSFELFVCRKERINLIEKMNFSDGIMNPPNVTRWFQSSAPKFGALRLGLLLTGLGLGICVAVMMNNLLDWQNMINSGNLPNRHGEILYLASMLLFGGLGLVIAHLMEQKSRKKD